MESAAAFLFRCQDCRRTAQSDRCMLREIERCTNGPRCADECGTKWVCQPACTFVCDRCDHPIAEPTRAVWCARDEGEGVPICAPCFAQHVFKEWRRRVRTDTSWPEPERRQWWRAWQAIRRRVVVDGAVDEFTFRCERYKLTVWSCGSGLLNFRRHLTGV